MKQHFSKLIYSVLISLLFTLTTQNINASKTYDGTVVPLIKSTINAGTDYGFNGILERVARIGSILKPQITDTEGNVIEKGTLVLTLNPKYWSAKVQAAKSQILASKAELLTAEENYKRYKYLSKTQSLSIEDYQSKRAAYYSALAVNQENEANLIEWQRVLDACAIMPPFEGIVDKIYFVQGQAAPQPQTIQISQLNPIGVKVRMPRIDANKIKQTTPVKIMFPDGTEYVGVFHDFSMLCDDGIIFATFNTPKYESPPVIDGKPVPVVRNCNNVLKFYFDKPSDILAVPIQSLMKDSKGYYVWKAKNQRNMQTEKGVSFFFSVEKVYVVPDNLQRMYGGFEKIRALKDIGPLKEFDLILSDNISANLKDGDTVCFPQERYVLMPGDPVKVIIGR